MEQTIAVKHFQGQVEITYQDLAKYHDKDHWGGVALAFKIMQCVSRELNPDQPLDRSLIRIRTGLNPPGLIDSFEFLTRAVTRQRLIVDSTLNGSPASAFGHFSFHIYYGDKAVSLKLKDGILPDDFAALGKKCESGYGSDEEQQRWNGLKHGLGDEVMKLEPEDLFTIKVHYGQSGE